MNELVTCTVEVPKKELIEQFRDMGLLTREDEKDLEGMSEFSWYTKAEIAIGTILSRYFPHSDAKSNYKIEFDL